MKAYSKNRKGLTLVELLVAIAITAVIIGSISVVLITGIKTYNMNFNGTIGQQSLRSAMITVTRKVRNAATGAVSITGAKVLTVSSKNFKVTSGKLYYDTTMMSDNISAISADYTDTSHKVIQVDLTSSDGNTLSTQIRVN